MLFPLDTVRTRLQSHSGFLASGGFARLYRGVGPVLVGSAPSAAAFFLVYDCLRPRGVIPAAVAAEVSSALVMAPVEVLKQHRQIGSAAPLRSLYRGFGGIVARNVGFSMVQFSIWERTREKLGGAVAGMLAGVAAAAGPAPDAA